LTDVLEMVYYMHICKNMHIVRKYMTCEKQLELSRRFQMSLDCEY
jgi:hypothetical protein